MNDWIWNNAVLVVLVVILTIILFLLIIGNVIFKLFTKNTITGKEWALAIFSTIIASIFFILY